MLRGVLALGFIVAAGVASATPVDNILPDAEPRGQATFRFLGLPIYHARLFTANAAPLSWQNDFAIELTYKREIAQKELVGSTLQEFDRLGSPLPLRDNLMRCFYDVNKGDRYLAVSDGPDRIRFWRNGKRTCTLAYPDIKKRFMSIFVGDNTRSQSFTRRLVGQ
ncbi:hypothetical protein ROA7450_03975 [Roseovarius albus]|uniref:Chalcone isomerase domain-containing protein n=1 Tax=Roseovarius albus TaxID=1247867 RepID=A0A1X7A762_9RHOB|nr:hypothetical protein [Roseovarius albus]SLN71901.1 hypothetical protein ROA7450_03975 [Roseovarius albus]